MAGKVWRWGSTRCGENGVDQSGVSWILARGINNSILNTLNLKYLRQIIGYKSELQKGDKAGLVI